MQLIVVRYAEIALKGGNREWFEKMLMGNIRQHLMEVAKSRVHKIHGRILIETEGEEEQVTNVLRHIPGIANFSYAVECDHELENMGQAGLKLMEQYLKDKEEKPYTFKVDARRSFKEFPMNSAELGRELGGIILQKYPDLKVQLKNPEIALGVEIWHNDRSILYLEKIQGEGGLPVRTSGNVISFLSGGIDSPVASWFMMKRGCKTVYLNFHSYPFIGEQSREKVLELVRHLSRYQPKSTLIIAPFTKIQKAIKENCTERYRTILYRRLMYRIAERLKYKYKITAYVTGEAVGQVASQTLENLACTEAAASLPVLRPLIGMEKAEIVDWSQKIGTYPISIQPHPDCCTVFQPRKPETKGAPSTLEEEENKIDFTPLIDEAIENLEVIEFKTEVQEKFWE